MSNFELIDDFLANRLNEQDRNNFEQQLAGDPSLKESVEFQQQVVNGVRHARAVELKSMLKNVPLNGSTWTAGKITTTAVSLGIVATSLYFYLREDQPPVSSKEEQRQENVEKPNTISKEPVVVPADSNKETSANSAQPAKDKIESSNKTKAITPVNKPDIQVVDPSEEFTETERATESTAANRSEISQSKMQVTTGLSDKKHNFHYQFVQSKLLLYGPFDKSLYEILEIHGESHAVFLFYRENYYLLDEQQATITALERIRDPQLLKKLKEYRGR